MSKSHGRSSKQERRAKARQKAIAAHPRRLAHETMMLIAPPWARVVKELIERKRPAPGAAPVLVDERELTDDAAFMAMLRGRFGLETQWLGASREVAVANVEYLCTLGMCAIDYEIGGRKAFWVDGGLAELLAETTLDISGDVLRDVVDHLTIRDRHRNSGLPGASGASGLRSRWQQGSVVATRASKGKPCSRWFVPRASTPPRRSTGFRRAA